MMRLATWTLAAALLLGACATAGGSGGADAANTSSLPRFVVADIDGGTFRMADHLNKDVVLLSFWATYCEPCKAEMPVLQRLHETYAGQGLKVLSVALDGPETVSGVKPHIRKNGYAFQVAVDEDTTIAQAYNPSGAAPFLVLIGRDGTIKKRIEGFQPAEAPAIEAEVKLLLGAH